MEAATLKAPQNFTPSFSRKPDTNLPSNKVDSLETRKDDVSFPSPSKNETKAKTSFGKFIELAEKYAGIIDSRESITRLVLDLSAFDIPVIISGALRNWKSFLEACFEASWSSGSLFVAPLVTKTIANIAGSFYLKPEEKKHAEKISRFYREELTDETSFQRGLQRILAEEPKDLERISKLYANINNHNQEAKYAKEAKELKDFFSDLSYSEDALKRFNKLKETTILGQSYFEGFIWGGFGFALRWFRKNILKENRFTGTKNYLSDKDSKKLGQGEELNWLQKMLGGAILFISPIINTTFMKLTRDQAKVNASPFLQLIKRSLDMTHGFFPKLGLLFSYTTIPKWTGALITTQGIDEMIERLIKLCTLIPSWWLGHRVANGSLAAYYDKKLSEKYNVPRGILLEPHYVGKLAPDPAKIHHVLESTEANPELQEEARKAHAKVLYAGITLHSLGVFLITLLVNQFTKWRVESKKRALRA